MSQYQHSSFNDILPKIERIRRTKIELNRPFGEAVRGFAKDSGTVILLSGTSLDSARYNILATKPLITITAKGEKILLCVDDGGGGRGGKTHIFLGDPLEFVNSLINHYASKFTGFTDFKEAIYPVGAGLFGYFSYDLKDRIESLPNSCVDQNLPDLYLILPSTLLIHDRYTGCVEKIELLIDGADTVSGSKFDIHNQKDQNLDSKLDLDANFSIAPFSIDPTGFRSNFSKSEYIEAVKRAIEYIKAGDIYQVNLSQRFSANFQGDSYSLFLKLFEKNPAPFFAFVNAKNHQIISTSPERFIKRDGNFIETRPIKGTIRRGENADEDKELGQALLSSLKDDAELSMIVDLMRNDFGKVAVGKSVKVKEHKRLEPYDNVFHLVSIVKALLAPDRSSVDLIRATFPGGSITGCPKIRSMEIIDELESVRRHVYTGSIGYISFHNTLDLSIAIRTAVVAYGKISFSVGGGIVFDSDPEKEYEETLHKGRTIMDTLLNSSDSKPLNPSDNSNKKAWVNGKIVDENSVAIPAHFTGFQYGAGLFETMRVQNGKILRIKEHIKRVSSSWRELFNEELWQVEQITWQNLVDNLSYLNSLKDKTAAAKLIVARSGVGSPNQEPHFIALFLRPYTHRLDTIGKNGLDLISFPKRRHTYLASHKSLNYLYYHLASIFAKERGFDEALILNADGYVSETNTASIISVSEIERKIVVPKSDYALLSVTLDAALTLFLDAGYQIVKKKITTSELIVMPNVIALNSLMGAVKVLSIDGKKIFHSQT
ncbi:MAG: aminodeoxychorismate synthase component I, partial [Desulfamplus sp.]|nr:aminodeoxychorismate synthase component I [Desulfamplus sp.]